MILSFDLGMAMGWASLTREGARLDSGRARFPRSPRARRWLEMRELAKSLIATHQPEVVVVERPVGRRGGGGEATFICHGGFLAQVEIEVMAADLPDIIIVSPSQWKLGVCGSGKAGKPEYIAMANEIFGLELCAEGKKPAGEDEAAALLVGLFHARTLLAN